LYSFLLASSWNVMAHGDAREGKWGGKWRMEWVASTLHATSEHGVSSITTADTHTSAANSRLNWRSRRFKWTRPFRRKTKSGFCACAITFQKQSTTRSSSQIRGSKLRETIKSVSRSMLLCVFRHHCTGMTDVTVETMEANMTIVASINVRCSYANGVPVVAVFPWAMQWHVFLPHIWQPF